MLRFLLSSGLAFVLASTAAAATWPGAAPCDGTLQACIDASAPGEVIEIATDGPIGEDIQITASLTLKPAAGFAPAFADDMGVQVSNQDSVATAVVLQGLTFPDDANVVAYLEGSGSFDLEVLDCDFESFTCTHYPIYLANAAGSVPGPVNFDIRRNQIDTAGDDCHAIFVWAQDGSDFRGTIADNVVSHIDGLGSGGILVQTNDAVAEVDIVANHLTGFFPCSAIQFTQSDSTSESKLLIANNRVSGQSLVCGLNGAVRVSVTGGTAQALIVNNTLARNDNGLTVTAAPGAALSGFAANNIVAYNDFEGIRISGDGIVDFGNDYNLIHGNPSNLYTPGPNTLNDAPDFAGFLDFHLVGGSPAIGAGDNSRVPGRLTTDIEGAMRISGPAVDLGAYEVQNPSWIFGDGFESGDFLRWSLALP